MSIFTFGLVLTSSYNPSTGLLEPSRATLERPPSLVARVVLEVFHLCGLIELERSPLPSVSKDADQTAQRTLQLNDKENEPQTYISSTTNFTLINVLLVRFGPMREQRLCLAVGATQVAGSIVAFVIRYGVGSLVYGGDRR